MLRRVSHGQQTNQRYIKALKLIILSCKVVKSFNNCGLEKFQCLARPPVKEKTMPVDLVLHSDMRAVERAEFDQQLQEKLSFIEQHKLQREREHKVKIGKHNLLVYHSCRPYDLN